MKWSFIFLAAALAVVYFGVTAISDRQANAREANAAVTTSAAPQRLESPEPVLASPATVHPPLTTEYVSGCIETATTCRCIDKQGKPLELTRQDCKGVLGVGPKE